MNLEDPETLKIVITISDARDYFGGCIPGWKTFAEVNNFEWKNVVRSGLTCKELLDTKDEMALGLVKFVLARGKL